MTRYRGKISRIIAISLCLLLFIETIPIYALENTIVEDEVLTKQEQSNEVSQDMEQEEPVTDENLNLDSQNEVVKDYSYIYENNIIKIYNQKQLEAIGTGMPVKEKDNNLSEYGTGEEVQYQGEKICYTLDRKYQLMNDIPLDGQSIWQLPENFTGEFVNQNIDKEKVLYRSQDDTVYIYHPYQLMTIGGENSENEPIMSNDITPAEFGTGNFLYKDGTNAGKNWKAAQEYLTYAKSHTYILSKDFTEKKPELMSNKAAQSVWLPDEKPDGRTLPGQVIYHDKGTGKNYILIGNETQLRAIGSNQFVTHRLYLYLNPKGIANIGKGIHFYPLLSGRCGFRNAVNA